MSTISITNVHQAEVEHHMFDAHPVLEATFEIQQGPNLKQVWSLPRSLDGLLFDKDALEIHCNKHVTVEALSFMMPCVKGMLTWP